MLSVCIQSQERDRGAWPDASDFVVDLGTKLERVKEVRLGTIELACGATQMTVEDGWNDRIAFAEGWRVDTGECAVPVVVDPGPFPQNDAVAFNAATPQNQATFGFPRNAPALFNHQLLIAQADADGRYAPELNVVLTVPPWLAEVARETLAAGAVVSPATVFSTVGCAVTNGGGAPGVVRVPHGMADYQTLPGPKPAHISAAMSTFSDIRFDRAADAASVSFGAYPPGYEFQFTLAAAVVGYDAGGSWDANAPTKLNAARADPDQRRHDSVACGFLHLEPLQQRELCAVLNHAVSRRPNRLNDYRFEFVGGEFRLTVAGGALYTHPTGQSSAPRLFFPAAPNAPVAPWGGGAGRAASPYTDPGVSVTPAAPACTSLGCLMGFRSGQSVRPARRRTRPNAPPEPVLAALGGCPPHFGVRVLPGFYDASSFAAAVAQRHNWGLFDGEAIGASETGPVSEFGFRDSTGCMHTVAVRSGKYFPAELAAALEYQLDRLDVNGARASTTTYLPGATASGAVKYTVFFDRGTRRFTFRCNRVAAADPLVLGAGVDFGLTFSAAQFRSVSTSAAVSPGLVAATLGFDGIDYAGRCEYVGVPVDVPGHPTTLSQGVSNGTVAPLAASDPGAAEGYGAGPAAVQYPSHPFGLAGTSPNMRRYCPNVRALPATGDASATLGPTTYAGGLPLAVAAVDAAGGLAAVTVTGPRPRATTSSASSWPSSAPAPGPRAAWWP